MTATKDWFEEWFDTKYYHILYKDRNDKEAQGFMYNLVHFLQLKKGSSILDLACGKGRHSLFLNSLGYNVIGADLSKNSIEFAKRFENETLGFEEHDMRLPLSNKYDAIFNLFTSFGYFIKDEEDISVLRNIKNGLKKDGLAVVDFLNVTKVKNHLVADEIQIHDTIEFHIKRKIENDFIIKEIEFTADGEQHHYFERVKYLDLPKIKSYLESVGLKLKHIFGDYNLEEFNEKTSNRLILVVE